MLDEGALRVIDDAVRRGGRIVALTGAGISAESGIPTFRGPEGYWTVGSRVHRPQDLATWATFSRAPELVWPWYLWRRGVCRAARPNAAHEALVRLEAALGDRFLLVTQNVDGLHMRAGTSLARLYPIHGSLEFMRCAAECTRDIHPLPQGLSGGRDDTVLVPDVRAALRCPACSGWARPHVLWFDECYDEERYHFDSAVRAAREAALLLVVGTSGATTLPALMAREMVARGAPILDVNAGENPFADAALASGVGVALRGPATQWVPLVVERIVAESRDGVSRREGGGAREGERP